MENVFIKQTPIYDMNYINQTGIINYGHKTYIIDLPDLFKIINFKNSFIFFNFTDDYPSFASNGKRYNYIEFIYSIIMDSANYQFKNGNIYDLRQENIQIYHLYHSTLLTIYPNAEYIQGHYAINGIDSFKLKNPLWKIIENGKEYFLMYCETKILCKLCKESYDKIILYEKSIGCKLTWYSIESEYICTHVPNINKIYYIHQIIMDCYGNGKGTKNISIDHIDRDKLNNTLSNLRLATRKDQEQNTIGIMEGTKRKRQITARKFPDGITHDMLPKYITYNINNYGKNKEHSREYFRIEKHPKLDKIWESSKSNAISIHEKLDKTKKILIDLENDIYPSSETAICELPKYINVNIFRDKPHLIFEKRENGVRLNLKMILKDGYIIADELQSFIAKIKTKYPNEGIDIR